MAPAGRDHTPNAAPQPLALAWIHWAGWSFTGTNIGDHVLQVPSMIWQYSREDLIVTGWSYGVVGWFQKEVHTEKEVIARE